MEIVSQNQNQLMKRNEVLVSLPSNSNPGIEDSKKQISQKFKSQIENIAIKSVKNNFGTNEFNISAFIYESISDKERIEPKQKAKKSAGAA